MSPCDSGLGPPCFLLGFPADDVAADLLYVTSTSLASSYLVRHSELSYAQAVLLAEEPNPPLLSLVSPKLSPKRWRETFGT